MPIHGNLLPEARSRTGLLICPQVFQGWHKHGDPDTLLGDALCGVWRLFMAAAVYVCRHEGLMSLQGVGVWCLSVRAVATVKKQATQHHPVIKFVYI